jgi:hypothetical protein
MSILTYARVYVGLDYHSSFVQVCVLDSTGRVIVNERCENNARAIAATVRSRVGEEAAVSERGACALAQVGFAGGNDCPIYIRARMPRVCSSVSLHGPRFVVFSSSKVLRFFNSRVSCSQSPRAPVLCFCCCQRIREEEPVIRYAARLAGCI